MYRVLCDRCGAADDGCDYYAWATPDQAVDVAVSDGEWLRIIEGESGEERLYCPSCTTWDEEADELVPLTDLAVHAEGD